MNKKYIGLLFCLVFNASIAADKLRLDCPMEYKTINTTHRYSVVVDFKNNEVIVDGQRYTASGVGYTVKHDDGTVFKGLMKVFQINEDFIEWGTANLDGSKLASDVISRVTGVMTNQYASGECTKSGTKF